MSTGLRRIIISILGLLAGAAAWPLMELILSYQYRFTSYFLFSLVQGGLFGVIMGAFFGSGQGLTAKERGKITRGALMGAAAGAVGGIAGFLAGQGVLFLVVRHAFTSYRRQQLIAVPLARVVGWAILGIAVGVSEGLRARSFKKTLVGGGGGLLGGVLGGASIEYLRTLYPELLYTRLIGFAVFGLLIGICYSLLERGVSLGILRILNGPNRGKEYSFAQNRLTAGSDNKNDIVLDGYSQVAPKHARFRVSGKDVYVRPGDEKEDAKIFVNEQPVKTEQLLKYEDVIQIGSAKLFFRTE